jgi:lipid II:glycine glycyltransferase (peptidoglycan interpeptide bridge formation enzyme)
MEPGVPKAQINNLQFKIYNYLRPGRKLFKDKTFILDLTISEEELLKNMHPKGRYNIKVAQKHGVVVKEDNSDEAFEKYLELMFTGTAKRQGIYSHGRDYHRQMWKALKNKIAHLFVAIYEKEIITADIIFEFKDKLYYAYSASKLEFKEVMAPTLLLWEIVKWGKNNKFKEFDLWGAEEGKGFSRFKEQFGGTLIETAGSFDLQINKWLYPIFRISEEARWKILRVLK